MSAGGATAHWGDYWAAGSLHSCHDAYADNYGGAIERYWRELLASLPRGARVLDLCCGNGALALLAVDHSEAKGASLEIHALDAAAIQPARTQPRFASRLAAVRFRGETPAEATGYPDEHFDAVIGQYALEYTDIERTVPEITRILKPGGTAAFIAHHRESVVVITAEEEARHIAFLLEEAPIIAAARSLIESAGDVSGPADIERLQRDSGVENLRRNFNALSARVTARIETAAAPAVMQYTLGQLGLAIKEWRAGRRGPALAGLERCEQALASNALRLEDLRRAAWTEEAARAALDRFTARGLRSESAEPVCENEQRLLGWKLVARREEGG